MLKNSKHSLGVQLAISQLSATTCECGMTFEFITNLRIPGFHSDEKIYEYDTEKYFCEHGKRDH